MYESVCENCNQLGWGLRIGAVGFFVIKAATTIMADGARQGHCPGQSLLFVRIIYFFSFPGTTGSPIVSPLKCIHVPICRLKRCSRAKKAETRHPQAE